MQKYILYLKITDIYIRDSKDDSLTDNKTTFLSPLLAKKKHCKIIETNTYHMLLKRCSRKILISNYLHYLT